MLKNATYILCEWWIYMIHDNHSIPIVSMLLILVYHHLPEQNHPNLGTYSSSMERLIDLFRSPFRTSATDLDLVVWRSGPIKFSDLVVWECLQLEHFATRNTLRKTKIAMENGHLYIYIYLYCISSFDNPVNPGNHIYPWVIKHSYWTNPIDIVYLPMTDGAFPVRYVAVYQRVMIINGHWTHLWRLEHVHARNRKKVRFARYSNILSLAVPKKNMLVITSGKRLHSCGKPHSFICKSTLSIGHFQ